MARRHDGEDVLDALFAAPPAGFVAARKEAAARLKAAGRAGEARAVAGLRRPTLSVWAANQLARRAPDDVGALLALGGRLRAAEKRLFRGGGAAELMADARRERQMVAALARRAEAIVAESGHQASATLARKVTQTLHAAAIGDDATRTALAAGRLTHDLSPPTGFGAPSPELAHTEPSPARRTHGKISHAREKQPEASHGKTSHARERRPQLAHASVSPPRAPQPKASARHAAAERKRVLAAERKRAAAERKRAAAELRATRRVEAAARKHRAQLRHQAAAADRAVAERRRAVERARQRVEAAERDLRAAKDALADAEQRATALHRQAGDEP